MKTLILIILAIPLAAISQVTDDFSDGNFTSNPPWTGDTAHFEVNQAGQLHLSSQGSDTSVLVTESRVFNAMEWRFWLKLSFNSSSNNFARIILSSDTADLFAPMHGYFLQAGGADDSISIFRQEGTIPEKIYSVRSYRTFHSTNTLRIRITRDETGVWTIFADTTGGSNYLTDGTFTDNRSFPVRWFGVLCRYTSSNATKFYFDDLYAGPIIRDSIPPGVMSAGVESEKVISVGFSEAVKRESAVSPSNYIIGANEIHPDSVVMNLQQPGVSLFLNEPLTEGVYVPLSVTNLSDLAGNRMRDTLLQVCYYRPKAYDVLINEIMADPDPPVDLPDAEFVELYNRTDYPIDMEGWTFGYGNYSKTFPGKTIRPKGYLMVVKDSAYLHYGDCAFLFTSSSSLSNEGTELVLKDSQHHIIHSVSYSPGWYSGSFKEDGGWSLEMADPGNPCGCMGNWGPSVAPAGGTPGAANSGFRHNPDTEAPAMMRAVLTDSAAVQVFFSEMMDSLSLLALSGWRAVSVKGTIAPFRVEPVAPGFVSTLLSFSEPFHRGVAYTIGISGVFTDCAGNLCDTTISVRFAFPDTIMSRDVVINEILSNPASGGARFVELYNRSERIVDLQNLVLANRDTADGQVPGAVPLSYGGYLFFPGEYMAVTPDPADICQRYRVPAPGALAALAGFPVLGDDTGTVVLARRDNFTIIDRVRYDAEMHYPLLATTEGVSLERTSPDRPSGDRDNWHSAAETAGFATPGYMNSHRIVPEATDQVITVAPVLFSPDNDGRDDLLTITVHEINPDCAITIDIYDAKGRLVRHLVNHVLLGSEDLFTWDGMTDTRGKAPLGFYILLAEITGTDGKVKQVKKTVVVGGKL